MNMKIILKLILIVFIVTSCNKEESIEYKLKVVTYIPDSLKFKHRDYIERRLMVTNYNAAKETADQLFGIQVIGLRKNITNTFDYIDILPNQLNEYEKKILDSLQKSK